MKSFYSIFTLIVCLQSSITAQNFEKSYPFYTDAFADAVFTQDDGYLAAFVSRKDIIYLSLIKTDLFGDTLWTRDHDLGLTGIGNTVGTMDSEGNLYLTSDAGSQNLVKLDQYGNILWTKYYQFSKKCLELNDGFLWMATNGSFLYKLDPLTGDSIWRSDRFGYGSNEGVPTSLAFLDNGNIVITSHIYDMNFIPSTEFYKFDPNTNTISQFELNTDIEFVITDSKGVGNEIWSIGNLFAYNNPTHTCYFIRYSDDGIIYVLSEHVFDYYANFQKLLVRDSNQVVILGSAFYINPFSVNLVLNCFSGEGDDIWTSHLGNENNIPLDLQIASDGGYLIGSSIEDQFNHVQPYLFKTDSLGVITFINKIQYTVKFNVFPNPGNDFITIESPGFTYGTVSLFNSIGQKCSETSVTSEHTTINVRNLHNGIYFCVINSDSELGSCKLIIE